jgi:lipoyl(octanoyl) transferase
VPRGVAGLEGDAGLLTAAWFGRVHYAEAWAWQRELFLARLDGERGDSLVLLEHPPTYTLGRRALEGDLLYGDAERAARGIDTFKVDRGGRATYHGPGQLVGYPIMALGERYDVIAYLRNLEDALVAAAADLGVSAHRDRRHTGVWVGSDKLAAIGVKITRGITMHGFAFNVSTDLEMFSGIVPCGIKGRWVTSIEKLTGRKHSVKEVASLAARHLARVFEMDLVWTHPRSLLASGAIGLANVAVDPRSGPALAEET